MKKVKIGLLLIAVVLACSTLLTFTLTSKNVVSFKKTEKIPNPDNLLCSMVEGRISPISRSGISMIVQEDRSAQIKGTSTQSFGVYLNYPYFHLEAGKTYTFTSGLSSSSAKTYCLGVYDIQKNVVYTDIELLDLENKTSGVAFGSNTFTCSDDSAEYTLYFYCRYEGCLIDDTAYPVLVEGTQPGDFYIEKMS